MQIPGLSGASHPEFSPFDPTKKAQDLIVQLENAVIEFINNLGREGELIKLQSEIKNLSEQLEQTTGKYKDLFAKEREEIESVKANLTVFQKDLNSIRSEELSPLLPALKKLYNSLQP